MLKKVSYVLDGKQKRNVVGLLLVIFFGAFVELLGVSAILPIVEVATNPNSIEEKWYLIIIQNVLNFSNAGEMVAFLAVALIMIYVIKNLYIMMMYDIQYHFIFNNQKNLAVKMMNSYMNQNYLFFVSRNVAELQRNVTSDVNGFYTVVLNFLQLLAEVSVCTVLGVYLILKDWVTTITIAVVLVIFVLFFARLFKKKLLRKGRENREVNALVSKWILQSFSGIKEIKVNNIEKFFLNNYDSSYSRLATIQRQQSMLVFIPRPVMETLCICGLLSAIVIRIRVGNGNISEFIPTLTVFAMAAFRMLPSFNRITGYLGTIMFNKPSIDAIYEDLLEVEELLKQKETQENTSKEIEFTNNIKFEHLFFHYPENEKYILKDANLTIEKNTSVAFVGASGAGKTTAADILLGILEPQEGKVTVDGVDICSNMKSWRSNIGYIPQTIYLTDDTIKSNIAFGIQPEDIDEERIKQVLKEAQLDEYVNGLEEGIETQIGDRGVKLSGGQRQRIGIARALYKNPDILILDEATSALDNNTEKEVMNAIDGLHGTRTMIVIAHRLSTIQKCDRVYEIGNGAIQEKIKP